MLKGDRTVSEEARAADTFIVINHSTVELPAIESYCNDVLKEGDVLLLWNLELETLRYVGNHLSFVADLAPRHW